ncbi:hypothetical protein [Kitasatospora purpeofusca]|uniref:hypothetical protein n=1 Tax=Kitasatospora purpeofusca TaxID=67352 RepID=UPI0036D403F4
MAASAPDTGLELEEQEQEQELRRAAGALVGAHRLLGAEDQALAKEEKETDIQERLGTLRRMREGIREAADDLVVAVDQLARIIGLRDLAVDGEPPRTSPAPATTRSPPSAARTPCSTTRWRTCTGPPTSCAGPSRRPASTPPWPGHAVRSRSGQSSGTWTRR